MNGASKAPHGTMIQPSDSEETESSDSNESNNSSRCPSSPSTRRAHAFSASSVSKYDGNVNFLLLEKGKGMDDAEREDKDSLLDDDSSSSNTNSDSLDGGRARGIDQNEREEQKSGEETHGEGDGGDSAEELIESFDVASESSQSVSVSVSDRREGNPPKTTTASSETVLAPSARRKRVTGTTYQQGEVEVEDDEDENDEPTFTLNESTKTPATRQPEPLASLSPSSVNQREGQATDPSFTLEASTLATDAVTAVTNASMSLRFSVNGGASPIAMLRVGGSYESGDEAQAAGLFASARSPQLCSPRSSVQPRSPHSAEAKVEENQNKKEAEEEGGAVQVVHFVAMDNAPEDADDSKEAIKKEAIQAPPKLGRGTHVPVLENVMVSDGHKENNNGYDEDGYKENSATWPTSEVYLNVDVGAHFGDMVEEGQINKSGADGTRNLCHDNSHDERGGAAVLVESESREQVSSGDGGEEASFLVRVFGVMPRADETEAAFLCSPRREEPLPLGEQSGTGVVHVSSEADGGEFRAATTKEPCQESVAEAGASSLRLTRNETFVHGPSRGDVSLTDGALVYAPAAEVSIISMSETHNSEDEGRTSANDGPPSSSSSSSFSSDVVTHTPIRDDLPLEERIPLEERALCATSRTDPRTSHPGDHHSAMHNTYTRSPPREVNNERNDDTARNLLLHHHVTSSLTCTLTRTNSEERALTESTHSSRRGSTPTTDHDCVSYAARNRRDEVVSRVSQTAACVRSASACGRESSDRRKSPSPCHLPLRGPFAEKKAAKAERFVREGYKQFHQLSCSARALLVAAVQACDESEERSKERKEEEYRRRLEAAQRAYIQSHGDGDADAEKEKEGNLRAPSVRIPVSPAASSRPGTARYRRFNSTNELSPSLLAGGVFNSVGTPSRPSSATLPRSAQQSASVLVPHSPIPAAALSYSPSPRILCHRPREQDASLYAYSRPGSVVGAAGASTKRSCSRSRGVSASPRTSTKDAESKAAFMNRLSMPKRTVSHSSVLVASETANPIDRLHSIKLTKPSSSRRKGGEVFVSLYHFQPISLDRRKAYEAMARQFRDDAGLDEKRGL